MKIIQPQVLVPQDNFNPNLLKKLERYTRVCYKSEGKMQPEGDPDFLKSKLTMGHESVIEHEKATVMFVVDRGISHEIVRHRIAAYSQESTRYCNYSNKKFGNEITVIEPFFFDKNKVISNECFGNYDDYCSMYDIWKNSCEDIEFNYFRLIANGATAQEARSILPNSLKTEIVVTYNMREWRHFFKLRCSSAAHPQMRQVAIPLLLMFKERLSVLFDDIEYDRSFDCENYAKVIITDELFNVID